MDSTYYIIPWSSNTRFFSKKVTPFDKNDVTLPSLSRSTRRQTFLTVKKEESCQSIWWKTHVRLLRTDLLK